jgi:hypothetical protein
MNTQNLHQLLQQDISSQESHSISINDTPVNIEFRDFYSFEELNQHPAILRSLAKCYQNIFSESDIWNEHYSEHEIRAKLELELSGHCAMRVCIDTANDQVVGFCWAQSLDIEQINHCMEGVKYAEGSAFNEVKKCLEQLLPRKTAVYLQDLGIDKNYRQAISLKTLILPPIASVAEQSSNQQLVFWSVAETCIAHIAKKAGILPFYQQNNMLFFCGALS